MVTPTNFIPPAVRVTLVVLNDTGSLFDVPPAIDALFRMRVPANALMLVRLIVALPVLP